MLPFVLLPLKVNIILKKQNNKKIQLKPLILVIAK